METKRFVRFFHYNTIRKRKGKILQIVFFFNQLFSTRIRFQRAVKYFPFVKVVSFNHTVVNQHNLFFILFSYSWNLKYYEIYEKCGKYLFTACCCKLQTFFIYSNYSNIIKIQSFIVYAKMLFIYIIKSFPFQFQKVFSG